MQTKFNKLPLKKDKSKAPIKLVANGRHTRAAGGNKRGKVILIQTVVSKACKLTLDNKRR
jgi:hypothetical protein